MSYPYTIGSFFRQANFYKTGGCPMLSWVVTFLIIAIIAGVLGFTGIAIVSVEIARIVFFIFIVLFVISLIMHLVSGSKGGPKLP